MTTDKDGGPAFPTIHMRCPKCGRLALRDGFRVRGQFCICGWNRANVLIQAEAKDD